jgi:hypothetical protein
VCEHDGCALVLSLLLEDLQGFLVVRPDLVPGALLAEKHEDLIALKVAVERALRPVEEELLEAEADEQV